jgi:hypothetical protein
MTGISDCGFEMADFQTGSATGKRGPICKTSTVTTLVRMAGPFLHHGTRETL